MAGGPVATMTHTRNQYRARTLAGTAASWGAGAQSDAYRVTVRDGGTIEQLAQGMRGDGQGLRRL
jgi:hypothetical protein